MPFYLLNCIGKMIVSFTHSKYTPMALLKAYWWLIKNHSLIKQKRMKLQREIICEDREVLSWMTSRLTNGNNAIQRFSNYISMLYCLIAGLRTIEFYSREKR